MRLLSFLLIFWIFATTNIWAQTVDVYPNLRTGKSYRVNDSIQIGKGSNADGSFKFISWHSALMGTYDRSVLSPGYAGTITEFKSFKLTGNKKTGQIYTAILKLSGNTGYNCVVELDNAFRFGELVPVGTPLLAKGDSPVREQIIYKEVPVKSNDESSKANKKLDDALQRSQRELDSLRMSRSFQDKQLKDKEIEIRMRQIEADKRAEEIRKLSEDTTARGQQIIENLEALKKMEFQNTLIQNQLEIERKEIQIREGEIEKQKIIQNSLITGISLVLIVLILLFYMYRVNKRNNIELSKRNQEILLQKEEIERSQNEIAVKNRQITDSISYAKRIQDASLPGIESIIGRFRSSLLYFRPRDIVSGDFYWFHESEQYQVAAVVDCTGHGVPGAFMSLIGSNLLAETVEVQETFEPGKILERMNERVQQVLRQSGDRKNPKDGMDMIIIVIDKRTGKLNFSGANRPLLHIRNQQVNVLRTNKFSIGGFYENNKIFNSFSIDIAPGDAFVMFTDGLSDQMGGDKKRKLSTQKLTEWMLEILELPDDQQYEELNKRMKTWQGNNRQLDDMLLWAFKV